MAAALAGYRMALLVSDCKDEGNTLNWSHIYPKETVKMVVFECTWAPDLVHPHIINFPSRDINYNRIATFKPPYHWTSVKDAAHMCFLDVRISSKFTKHIWTPSLMEVHWDCHISINQSNFKVTCSQPMRGYQTQMLRIQINIQDQKAMFCLLLYFKNEMSG